MKAMAHARTRWLVVAGFAIAMAWMEAATVYYLRVLVDRLVPYQADPLPVRGTLGGVELVREAATLIMLLMVGILAGRTWQTRIAYSAIAFGVWDIFYYLFLWVIYGWPTSILEWDILFLLPLPWWGPVIAPVSVAMLMIVWGTLVSQRRPAALGAPVASAWFLNALGILLALYVFMADALHVAPQGAEAVRNVLPTSFNWLMFTAALALMAAPVAHLLWRRPRVGAG